MNPYETPVNSPVNEPQIRHPSAAPDVACVISTGVSMILSTVVIIWRMDTLLQPSMSVWMFISLFLSLVATLPLAMVVTMVARFCHRLGMSVGVAARLLVLAPFVTFLAIDQLVVLQPASLLLSYGAMLAVMAITPSACGLLAYSVARLVVDQRAAQAKILK